MSTYKVFVKLLLLLLCSTTMAEAKFFSAAIARERLVTDLFVNYDAAARPAPKTQRIDLHFHIMLQHFQFREKDGAFHFIGLMAVSWLDPKLSWNPTDYNNLTRIPVNQRAIWVPDLEMYNNAPDKFLYMHRNGVVFLEHTGMVLWSNHIEVTVFCTTNMRNWPHDSHSCKLSLGSWTYHGFELDIMDTTNLNASMDFAQLEMENMEYRVVNYGAVRLAVMYSCCEEPYITVEYHIEFQRRSAYVSIFRAIALSVMLLSLLSLGMETCRSEKIWLNAVAFIVIIFNLIYFARNIGRFSRGTPLIVTFYSTSLVLVTLAHLITVFSLFATRSRFYGKMHPRVSGFLHCALVRCIAPAQSAQRLQPDHAELNAQFEDVKLQEFSNLISNDATPNEWVQLANVIERIAVLVFGLAYVILSSACFV